MAVEYLVPTRKQRIRLLIRIILTIILALAIKLAIPYYVSFVSEKSLCEQVLWLRYTLSILFLIGIAIIYRLVKSGYLLLINNQFPLQGTDVFFRTKIVRGWRVKIEAFLLFVIAVGIFLGLIYLAQTDFIVEFFTTQCIDA